MFAEHMKRGTPWDDNPFGNPILRHSGGSSSSAAAAASSASSSGSSCSSEAAASQHFIPIQVLQESFHNQFDPSDNMMDMDFEPKQINKIEIPDVFKQADEVARKHHHHQPHQHQHHHPNHQEHRPKNIPAPLHNLPQPDNLNSPTNSPFGETAQQPLHSPSYNAAANHVRHIPIIVEGKAAPRNTPSPTPQSPHKQQHQQQQQQQQPNHPSPQHKLSHKQQHTQSSSNNNNSNNNNNNETAGKPGPIPMPPPPSSSSSAIGNEDKPPSPPPRSPKNKNKPENSTFPPQAAQIGVAPEVKVEPIPTIITATPAAHSQQQNCTTAPTNTNTIPILDESQIPPPIKKPTPHSPLEKVQEIVEDVKELDKLVSGFTGRTKTKHYLYLDEMLTRKLITLDNIEVGGKEEVRQARKDCIKLVQNCINKLESKLEDTAGTNAEEPQQNDANAAAGLHRSEMTIEVNPSEKKDGQNCGGKPGGAAGIEDNNRTANSLKSSKMGSDTKK